MKVNHKKLIENSKVKILLKKWKIIDNIFNKAKVNYNHQIY
jgi:hypothetical protein